jgi:hypothetical protein
VRERGAALLKIAQGQSAHAVACHGLLNGRDPDTVDAWLDHDQTEGLSGLVGHAHGGSHRGRLRAGRATRARASG